MLVTSQGYSFRYTSMLRYYCVTNSSIKRHFSPTKVYSSTLPSSKLTKEKNSLDVDPPLKRYKNSTSIIRALISCVQPVPEAPNFNLGPDFSAFSIMRTNYCMLAKAKGRLAARVSARDFFPNDIAALSKEIPLVDRWVPIQTPDSIVQRAVEGSLSNDEAMDRLILLIAPKDAWKLYYKIAPDYKWTSDTLHRLLDLLCVTNSGKGGAHSHLLLNNFNWSNLPDPDEIYVAGTNVLSESNHDKHIVTEKNQLKVTAINHDEINDEITDSTVSLEDSNVWNLHTYAEQLFNKEFNTLNTPAGYRSMIRGAARFGNSDRALELTKLAWQSKYSEKCLDLTTYNQLIRSLHHLTCVKTGKENIWNIIMDILEHVKNCDDPINVSVFTNIFYALGQTTIKLKSSSSSLSSTNYVSIGLGLLDELKRLHLKPELGTLANLLLLIYETPVPVNETVTSSTAAGPITNQNKSNTKMSLHDRTVLASYKCSDLLNKLLDEVEVYFNNNNTVEDGGLGGSPQRFDAWSMDDYTFFPIAMKCALNEWNLALGERIHRLLIHHEDRTFLLPNSQIKYKYLHNYCRLMLSITNLHLHQLHQFVERFHKTYYQYYRVILSSKPLIEMLIRNYSEILTVCNRKVSNTSVKQNIHSTSTTVNQLQNVNLIKLTVYNHLCKLLDDVLSIDVYFFLHKSPNTIKSLINILCQHAKINPKDALDLSMKIINIFKKLDNDILKTTTTISGKFNYDDNVAKNNLSVAGKYKSLINLMLSKCIQLCFPIFEKLSTEHNRNNKNSREEYLIWKTKLIDALYEWFNYAEKHNAISWEWAPKGLFILWNEDDFIQMNFMWNAIQCLAKKSNNYTDCVMEHRSLLEPLLKTLEQSISKMPQDIESIEKLKCLQFMKRALSIKESTDALPQYSDISNSVGIRINDAQ
ncbi:pentatricopeptide repeat domain-containing protein 3 [Schistosoma japonicum]|nr:pentatricopeptide repeat domain-containing protein 3 [Schistosoma japonicum]KAH8852507.1 pentatricopeptide repeat domain-containing protein 3 [Schistosoma japonicum]KAH8852508.1 pentatricopeptide repeat domain-containing protein 3 [Schistosoma japonicum]KAH8852509.1 pentatricopeptide repeat domain-containing protein 3 [Schistosoma japonicum]